MPRSYKAVALLILAATPLLAQAPLSIDVTVEPQVIQPGEPFEVSVTLTNVTPEVLVVPAIEPRNQSAYFRLNFIHLETGVPAFFLNAFSEEPRVAASNTMQLPAQTSTTVVLTVNSDGSGPLGYPGGNDNLQMLAGDLLVEASFEVNSENLPTAGDGALFRGTVTTASPALVFVEGNRGTAEIPTLTTWGFVGLALALLCLGLLAISRHRRATDS